ncbi:MAG: RHS repeat-associated core domain-containing protein, partial [Candidatus Staskawiczbacteria bacterium]|nr:RHS repeat-associated core domain-containing protein [Candidatus Staskawiczbacteria bacterium]
MSKRNVIVISHFLLILLVVSFYFLPTITAAASFNEQRKFIGQEYDAETGLNYLNARYYNSNIGRFISQDPMFWTLPVELLTDPQNQNSYAYARNNPIV